MATHNGFWGWAIAALAAVLTAPAVAQTAPKIDFGEPAPQWLRESESYAMGGSPDDWDALAESKVKFITHCPVNREFFARCHALGIPSRSWTWSHPT
jgi:hypothetical protein